MHRYEALMRDAHIAGLELALELRRVQTAAGLTAIAGHAMFERFDEGQAQLSKAIGTVAAGHRLARAIAPIAGINPEAYGETTDPSADAHERRAAPLLSQVV